MLHDLVSPWAALVETADSSAMHAFTQRHADLLNALHRQHAPDRPTLDLATDRSLLGPLAARTAGRTAQLRITGVMERAATAGADIGCDVVLLAGDARGDLLEVIPHINPPTVVVFAELAGGGADGMLRLHTAVARGIALATRWRSADSSSVLATGAVWDRWTRARDVPLSEWIYSEGVATHLALTVEPQAPPHLALGVSRGAYALLRQQERALRARLAADLDRCGLGPMLRWLVRGADSQVRNAGVGRIPDGAGRYLAWRMTVERVQRLGLRDALRRAS
ncbi:MAG: hypothetical protein ABIR59_11965 [Gemmatimonadales bacterium]